MNLRPLPPEGGFGARRQQGPAISYFVKYRTADGRQRWQVIGRHGVLTPDEARDKARAILGDVVDGADPAAEKMAARKAITVAELCDLYLVDAEAGRLLTRRRGAKKAGTLLTDRGRITRHIKPLLGRMAVAAVDRTDIERFMTASPKARRPGASKPGASGWRASTVARGPPPARSVCSVRSSLMRCGAPGRAEGQPGSWRHALCRWAARKHFPHPDQGLVQETREFCDVTSSEPTGAGCRPGQSNDEPWIECGDDQAP